MISQYAPRRSAIPADAPHPENAHAFLAYLLEPEVIASCTNWVNYANGNAASKPFVSPEILSNPSIYPDEATVKRFFRENGRIRLQPENSALEPIYAPHVEILGKVVGVFREL